MKQEKIKIREKSNNPVISICLDTIEKQKQALVFVNTKRGAENCAEQLSAKITSSNSTCHDLSKKALSALPRPTKQCERLSKCLKKGIAFHHAGLTSKQRQIIEENFRNGNIKIISSTPTLAAGLDLPAFRTIIRDLKRYGHRGYQPIPVLEYHQMAGRAGRPRFDKTGEAICIAETENQKESIVSNYIFGDPEPIYSKLAVEPVLRTYLLSLIASGFVDNKKSIMEFFSGTFWAHQYQDIERLEEIITKMLMLLEEWEFILISSGENAFVSANELDTGKIRATALGKRVAELYIDPYTAHHFIKGFRKTSNQMIRSFALLHLISDTLEMRPLLNVRTKDYEKIEEKLAVEGSFLLKKEPSIYDVEYEDFLNSIKTAMLFEDWTEEKDEDFLLEEYNSRPGETRSKLEISDWLLYCCDELTKILKFQDANKEVKKLRFRIRHGIKEELIPLVRLEQIGRVRARMLYRNKIRDIGDIRKTDFTKLAQILGKNIAIKLKEQVGEDYSKIKVKDGKRKGQISLLDY